MLNEGIPTWRDFPEFYNNPFVKQIENIEKWTVSDKNKRPIDMHALIHEQKVWGMAFDRGYNPLVDLKTLCNTIPSATNNAYYLDALVDKYVVLDIEPKCPEHIKQKLMELPYVYGEISMSGKGVHLVFSLPENILNKYPDAQQKQALKEENGYYEILLNHMITFTRNALPPSTCREDISIFDNVFELLAMKAKPNASNDKQIAVTSIKKEDIPYFDTLIAPLRAQKYNKSAIDFKNDISKYEFAVTGFYHRALMQLLDDDNRYKDHQYTDEEKAVILYSITSEKIPYRPKHDQTRNDMPWLLFIATRLLSKSDPTMMKRSK